MRKDFDAYNATGEKTRRLRQLEEALLSISPTSVEAERAFSSAGNFVTKIRSRLSDDTIDDLCYGRSHLLTKFGNY